MPIIPGLTRYVAASAGQLLSDAPFAGWEVARDSLDDLGEVHYTFSQNGLQLRCTRDEKIISMHASIEGNPELATLFGVPENLSDAREALGTPEKRWTYDDRPRCRWSFVEKGVAVVVVIGFDGESLRSAYVTAYDASAFPELMDG